MLPQIFHCALGGTNQRDVPCHHAWINMINMGVGGYVVRRLSVYCKWIAAVCD
jgi:hypothetical protein